MSERDRIAPTHGRAPKLLLRGHLPGISLYLSACYSLLLSFLGPPLIPSTNLFSPTSVLSLYLPLYLAADSPCDTDWLFPSLSLQQVIVQTRSCCVADSWDEVKPKCWGAGSLPSVPFPGSVGKEQSFSSTSALVKEIGS